VINDAIDTLRQQYALQQQSSAVTDEQTQAFQQTVATAQDLRDKIANFDDFFRPLRNCFYWEPHCFDIPACWALRSLFDALDGIDALTDQLSNVSASITKLDELQPKLLALIPPQIANQQTNRDLAMTNYATTSGIDDQTAAALQMHRLSPAAAACAPRCWPPGTGRSDSGARCARCSRRPASSVAGSIMKSAGLCGAGG
jgi:putative drug exporter of the RND superfamily